MRFNPVESRFRKMEFVAPYSRRDHLIQIEVRLANEVNQLCPFRWSMMASIKFLFKKFLMDLPPLLIFYVNIRRRNASDKCYATE